MILKNAILKHKVFIITPVVKINLDILKIFKQVGLILNFYKTSDNYLKIIFYYPLNKPA